MTPDKKTTKPKSAINAEINFKDIGQKFGNFIGAHGAIIFVVLSLGLLTYSVYAVQLILSSPEDSDYRGLLETQGIRTRFDQATIDKVNQLRNSQQAVDLTLPPGRINPFSE